MRTSWSQILYILLPACNLLLRCIFMLGDWEDDTIIDVQGPGSTHSRLCAFITALYGTHAGEAQTCSHELH